MRKRFRIRMVLKLNTSSRRLPIHVIEVCVLPSSNRSVDGQALVAFQVDAEAVQDPDGVEVEYQFQAATDPRHRGFRLAVKQQICRWSGPGSLPGRCGSGSGSGWC